MWKTANAFVLFVPSLDAFPLTSQYRLLFENNIYKQYLTIQSPFMCLNLFLIYCEKCLLKICKGIRIIEQIDCNGNFH